MPKKTPSKPRLALGKLAGKKVATAPRPLDVGWRGIWPAVTGSGAPVISGGRSAGARVAWRTAAELGAPAGLALAPKR